MKLCKECGRELPLAHFNKGSGRDGLRTFCKDCSKIHYSALVSKLAALPPTSNTNDKWCGRCKKELPRSNFCKSSSSRDGLANWCRDCRKVYYDKLPTRIEAKKRLLEEKRAKELRDAERDAERDSARKIRIAKMELQNSEEPRPCNKCGIVKSVDEFHFKAKSSTTRTGTCKQCKKRLPKNTQEELSEIGMRFCSKCKKVKPLDKFEYLRRKGSESVKRSTCVECYDDTVRWKNYLKRMYGITPEQYQDILDAQGGVCAICGGIRRMCLDHDHETGAVRGILCENCNYMIGNAYDSQDTLLAGARYLAAWKSSSAKSK